MSKIELYATTNLPQNYADIIGVIEQTLPIATRDTENFNKTSSQFKSATLDVVDLTPISSARHLLAVIQRTRQALEEASVTLRRKKLELNRKERLLTSANGDEAEELLIDIDEIHIQIANSEAACRGALRKLSSALDQYQSILTQLGKDRLTEVDYEQDQARYHIMTAFNQALTAARAHGGIIDEGNHIYLMQLGINGAVAQAEVTALLNMESELLNNNKAPTHDMIVNWLEALADRFMEAPEAYAQRRGLKVFEPSLVLEVK